MNKIIRSLYLSIFFNRKISCISLIDSKSVLSKKCKINRFVKVYNSIIGSYTYVGSGSLLLNSNIGKYCSIAKNSLIGLANHTINNLSTSPIFTEKVNGTGFSWINNDLNHSNITEKRTSIGNDVWIGERALIMSGLNIGDGSIIGAGSIVTKDVPPYSICAGVPARVLKFRFSDEVIIELERIKWWDIDEELIKENINLFQTTDVNIELINILRK